MDPSVCPSQEVEEAVDVDHISYKRKVLLAMNFSVEEIDYAINFLGDDAPIKNLLDFIVTAQTAGSSGQKDTHDNVQMNSEEITTNMNPHCNMEKAHALLEMGFLDNEVSEAIRNLGANASILDLADSICTRQVADASPQNYMNLQDASVEAKMEMLKNASVIALL